MSLVRVADPMRVMVLDSSYCAYLNLAPGYLLAAMNTMSLFGLHGRLCGASIDRLVACEMSSSIPCRMIPSGMELLGFNEATGYFNAHSEAGAVHEQIAGRDLAGGLGQLEPLLTPDIFFEATACLAVDARA